MGRVKDKMPEYSEITKYIFLHHEDAKGDVAVVFGTGHSVEHSTKIAVNLYKEGRVKKLLLTGGRNKILGFVEADEAAKIALAAGVPSEDILIENQSTNTLENVLFAKKVLEEQNLLSSISKVLAISKNYHMRRSLMTCAKHFPKNIVFEPYAYTSIKYTCTDKTWTEKQEWIDLVVGEFEKIKEYLKMGDIEEISTG